MDRVIELRAGDLVVENPCDNPVGLRLGDGFRTVWMSGLDPPVQRAVEEVEIARQVADNQQVGGEAEGKFGKSFQNSSFKIQPSIKKRMNKFRHWSESYLKVES